MTTLKHTALVCASEENADRFYRELLGLTKAAPKILPRHLTVSIFNVDAELQIINYTGDGIHFEIFIDPEKKSGSRQIEHTCVEIENCAVFLETCQKLEVNVHQISRGDRTLLFVHDFDGNLFEVKSRQ